VRIVNPFKPEQVELAVREETMREEPSVIIATAPCELLDKKRKRIPYRIDIDKCKNCGMCMKLGCPAIQKKDGKMMINDTLCSGCGLCAKVCKFGAIVKDGE
jgi:indolepyruvate ferredoxin oxidoreductase alpha subunit